MRILSFDPGGTTGWASHSLYNGELTGGPDIDGGQLGPHPHHIELWRLIEKFNPDVLVYEDFQYRMKKDEDGSVLPAGIVLTSVEYIGLFKLFGQSNPSRNVKLYSQLPVHGKGFWTDDKLKRVGVHKKGRPHQNDATRHLLHYITTGLMRKDYLHAFKPTQYKKESK